MSDTTSPIISTETSSYEIFHSEDEDDDFTILSNLTDWENTKQVGGQLVPQQSARYHTGKIRKLIEMFVCISI